MKLQKQFGYNFAVLGIIFLFVAVFMAFYRSDINYPYQVYTLPLFTVGIVFVVSGIAQVWIHYFKHERKPKPLTPKIVKQQEFKMEIQQQPEAKLVVNDPPIQQKPAVKQVINNPPVQNEENTKSYNGTAVSLLALIFSAIFAISFWNYEESINVGFGLSYPINPYRGYSVIFAIVSLISFAALLFSIIHSSKSSTQVVQTVNVGTPAGHSKILCGNCGIANDLDARYCKNCGNTFH